ncbi:hypothetical protein AOLI_G00109260 [Acnodon oligacanthus]
MCAYTLKVGVMDEIECVSESERIKRPGWKIHQIIQCLHQLTLCCNKKIFAFLQFDLETECRDRYFYMPFPGSQLQFQAFGAGEAYPITAQHGELCGYTVRAVLDHIVLKASYFSCHTDNQNDEVFSFKEVLCEDNYMEVSVSRDLSCPYAGNLEDDLTKTLSVGSVVSGWQIMLEKEGQHSVVMSAEKAATLGYFLISTIGRIFFCTAFG